MNKGGCLSLPSLPLASVAAGTYSKRRTAHWLTVFYCPGILELEVTELLAGVQRGIIILLKNIVQDSVRIVVRLSEDMAVNFSPFFKRGENIYM